jgi:hypothetical protein
MRLPVLQREKVAILFLRKKKGYSINILSKAFNRSASLIHQIIKFNTLIGNLKKFDNRALPQYIKKIATTRQTQQLSFYMEKWVAFILGEGDKPP